MEERAAEGIMGVVEGDISKVQVGREDESGVEVGGKAKDEGKMTKGDS